MLRRNFRLLCFTSTQKHSTWNTNGIRSKQYSCGWYSGRCWWSKFERRIGILQTLLTDNEMENGRHRIFIFSISTYDMSLLNDKLEYVFKELRCAGKVNHAFGFALKNIEDGLCRFFSAHENNTIIERSEFVCAQADMTYLNHFRKTNMWIALLLREIRDNPTMTISVCLQH